MDFEEGWLSWLIFILIIVILITIGIKILIEYPGLADVKCVYVEETDEEFPKDDGDLSKMKEYYVNRGLSKDTSTQCMSKNEKMSKSQIRKEDLEERMELKYCSDDDVVDDALNAIKVSKESVKDVRLKKKVSFAENFYENSKEKTKSNFAFQTCVDIHPNLSEDFNRRNT